MAGLWQQWGGREKSGEEAPSPGWATSTPQWLGEFCTALVSEARPQLTSPCRLLPPGPRDGGETARPEAGEISKEDPCVGVKEDLGLSPAFAAYGPQGLGAATTLSWGLVCPSANRRG